MAKKRSLALRSFRYNSEHTIDKQYLLERVYFELLQLFKKKQKAKQCQRAFVAVDGGAGCGHFGKQGNIPGSPFVALEVADKLDVPLKLFAIEKEKKYFKPLQRSIKTHGWDKNTILSNNKCENVLEEISRLINGDMGIFYFDLCGPLPMPRLVDITNNKDCDNMDLLIHYSYGGVARTAGRGLGKHYDFKKLNRKYIISSQLYDRPRWRFVFATNNASHARLAVFKYLGFKALEGWQPINAAITTRGKIHGVVIAKKALDSGLMPAEITEHLGVPHRNVKTAYWLPDRYAEFPKAHIAQFQPPTSVVLPASVM